MENNSWHPIAEIQDQTRSFVAWTSNNKVMVFNNKTADDWLISKYSLTHYMIPKPPNYEKTNSYTTSA